MKSTFRALCALLSVLAAAQAAQAAPPRAAGRHAPNVRWAKRQPGQLTLTETHTEVLSETLTATFTDTITTSESDFPESSSASETTTSSGSGSGSSSSSSSSSNNNNNNAVTLTDTSAFHLPTQGRHVEGEVPNQDPSAQGIFFLPADSSASPSATGTTTTTGASLAVHTPVVQGPLLSAYYPYWAADVLPPESIDMSRLDWIDFAFGNLNQNCSIGFDSDSSQEILKRIVSVAHSAGKKVKLSIGGWDGSRYFSACSSQDFRDVLVNNTANIYNEFDLDGIDIDWEYPGQQGEGQNGVSAQDSDNMLQTLRRLRSVLPEGARLSAAVQDVPIAGSDGNPMSDVSDFADVLDWVIIMNYDVFGSSSNPGPNAPLSNGCGGSSQPQFNARAAINAWTNAKFPASRLMLGIPFYGYLNPSSSTQLQHKKRSLMRRQTVGGVPHPVSVPVPVSASIPASIPVNPTSVVPAGLPPVSLNPISMLSPTLSSAAATVTGTVPNVTSGVSKAAQGPPPGTVVLQSGDGTSNSGQIQILSLVQQGALVPVRTVNSTTGAVTDSTTFLGARGFTRFWDSCSSTPFLTSPYTDQVVTYDDPESLGLKAAFANQSGILGTAVWDLSGDTPQWDMLDALRRGLGKPV